MFRIFKNLFVAGLFLVLAATAQANPIAYAIELNDDTINPVTSEYIAKSIEKAHADGAACLIIKLDTPGGLLSSTRSIVKKMMTAKVPVIVYISPSGSRAGSAGVFITYASHVAAMAPSTNIGAAHPVEMGGGKDKKEKSDYWDGFKEMIKSKEEKTPAAEKKSKEAEESTPDDSPMSSKILQDTVAFIKALAQERNRNLEWGVKSVTKSSSITETEALKLGVVEFIAKDETELLEKIDGRKVKLPDGEATLKTKGAEVVKIEMTFRQRLLNVLANPNIAYIFLMLGFWGLLYEVTHPGIGVPGVLGAVFLILAFYSMQTLPTNYAGVALIIIGLLLIIGEALTPGFGLLLLGGIGCMVLGSIILFDSPIPLMRVSMSLIWSVTLATAGLSLFLVTLVMRTHKRQVSTGAEGLVGEQGEARSSFKSGQKGQVFVHGEIWRAVSDDNIRAGDPVSVVKVNGLTLKVKKD